MHKSSTKSTLSNVPSRALRPLKLGFVLCLVATLVARYLTSDALTRGVPVLLSYGPTPMRVTDNLTLVDIVQSCTSLYGDKAMFVKPWWLPTGNMQTLWSAIGDHSKIDIIPYQRQHLRVPDSGTLVLDVYPPFTSAQDSTPIVTILHGLTGSSQESYIRAIVGAVSRSKADGGPGFRAVVLNFRGCDGTPVTSPRLYHAGETDDYRSVLLYLTQTYPNAPLYGVGFSMGASTLAVYLGEEGMHTPLKGVVTVSNPWDWVAAAEWIETGSLMNRLVYGPVLADALRHIFRSNLHAFSNDTGVDIPTVLAKKWFTIRWYDDHVTSKLFGFEDGHDYYVKTSSKQHMPNIAAPLLNIYSTDDPIIAAHNMPMKEVLQTNNIVFAATHGGGHVGWFTNEGKRWYTVPAVEYIEALFHADPAPKPGPAVLAPNADGLVTQANMSERVGFQLVKGGMYKPTGRHIQGF